MLFLISSGKSGWILFGSFIKHRQEQEVHLCRRKRQSPRPYQQLEQKNPFKSVFLLPKSFCLEIERMLNAHWWVRNLGKREGICWSSWENLATDRKGWRRRVPLARAFKKALFAKQAWRIMTHNTNLCPPSTRQGTFKTPPYLNPATAITLALYGKLFKQQGRSFRRVQYGA